MKLQATAEQYGGGGVMIDTSNYERIRMISNQELEKEFKEVYKIKTINHYF